MFEHEMIVFVWKLKLIILWEVRLPFFYSLLVFPRTTVIGQLANEQQTANYKQQTKFQQ